MGRNEGFRVMNRDPLGHLSLTTINKTAKLIAQTEFSYGNLNSCQVEPEVNVTYVTLE